MDGWWCGGCRFIHKQKTKQKTKQKCLPFWQYMRPLPFKTEHDLLYLFHVFFVVPPAPLVRESIRPYAVCGHAISDEIGLQEFGFFFRLFFFSFSPTDISCLSSSRGGWWGGVGGVRVDPKGLQLRVPFGPVSFQMHAR